MEIEFEKFVCSIIICHEETGKPISVIYNRESFDAVLNIERDSFDDDQYIRIGDILTIDETRYKVTGSQFHLSQYKLDENKQMKGDSMYSETPANPTNCYLAVGVERLD
jgi:hypothetical protein